MNFFELNKNKPKVTPTVEELIIYKKETKEERQAFIDEMVALGPIQIAHHENQAKLLADEIDKQIINKIKYEINTKR